MHSRTNNLKIKLSKCKFAQRQLEYLSHIIHVVMITPNPAKIEAVVQFKEPYNVKTVQSFLGLLLPQIYQDLCQHMFTFNPTDHETAIFNME